MVITQAVNFILNHPSIFIFYGIIIALLIIFRKKIDVQGKIIFLYRMKWGLKWMDKYATKHREWVILLGYVGMGAGFVGLVFISYILIKNLVSLFLNPAAASGVSLVLPGINIPGLGVLPFWYWIIAIFLIAIVHEFSHGIVARAHNIKVKNTGIVLFGPIIGAFVEPDEKKLSSESDIKQYSVLAAGAFSNVLLALVALILLTFVTVPLQNLMIEPAGFTFDAYTGEEYPVAQAGIMPGAIITSFNGQEISKFEQVSEDLYCTKPGETIDLVAGGQEYSVKLTENPDNPKKGFMGIQQIRNEVTVKEAYTSGIGKVAYYSLEWLNGLSNGGKGLLFWVYLLSFGIGLFNLLPLPLVDGGRMAQTFLHKLKGKEKGEKAYRRVGMFFLIVLLLNLFFPLLIKLF